MTGEADRRWSKASSASNGDRRWLGDSGRGEARLGVGEGGGGAGEGARARNRSMVAGVGRSTEGGDGGTSRRASLVSGPGGNEEGGDDDRAHIQLNIWALLWRTVRRSLADRPQFSGCYNPTPLKKSRPEI